MYDPDCGTFWCDDCATEREMTINLPRCSDREVVLSCPACLNELVFSSREERND